MNGSRTAKKQTGTEAVDAFLSGLDHPLKPALEAVRAAILAASAGIGEGIKWNAPSFRAADYFATFHLRSRDRVQLVFHTGAKKKDAPKPIRIADPAGLMKWLAPDRCLITIGDAAGDRDALQAIVREWILLL